MQDTNSPLDSSSFLNVSISASCTIAEADIVRLLQFHLFESMPFILPSPETVLSERRLAVASQAFSELAQYKLKPGYISGDGYLASQQKKVAVSNDLAADRDVFVWNAIVDFKVLILTMKFKLRGGD